MSVVSGLSGRVGATIVALSKRQVMANAASMFGTTAVTSLLGFVFWGAAARVSPTAEVGAASAAISAMQLIGNFCTLGLSTMIIAHLGATVARRALITSCLTVATTVATVAGAGYAIGYDALFPGVGPLYDSVTGVAIFAAGVGITTLTMVIDGALVGLLQGHKQLWRNVIYSAVKVAAVLAFAFTTGAPAEMIYLAWLLANVVSLIALLFRVESARAWLTTRPSLKPLRGLGRMALGHHWVNVATQAPRLILPVFVATQLGNEANAAFYAALLLAGIAWIVPNHISTAMFAVSSHDPLSLRFELRSAIKICAILSGLALVGSPLLARPLLLLFGNGYDNAATCLAVLGAVTFAAAVKSLYIAVRRAQNSMASAAWATTFGAAIEVAAAQVGLNEGGLDGLAWGLAAAMTLEALLMCVPVRAEAMSALGGPRHLRR